MTHLVLATMLLAVSGLVYFYFSREPEPEPQIVLAQAEPSVSIQSPAVADEVEEILEREDIPHDGLPRG